MALCIIFLVAWLSGRENDRILGWHEKLEERYEKVNEFLAKELADALQWNVRLYRPDAVPIERVRRSEEDRDQPISPDERSALKQLLGISGAGTNR